MAFQGLLYAASYDHLSVPLMTRDNVNLSPELLEEVKNVLIPAEMLRIEDSQIIGKGRRLRLFRFFISERQKKYNPPIYFCHTGHFGTVYHGFLIDSNNQETHCAVKSLNSTLTE